MSPIIALTADSYLSKGAKLTISYDCNAEEKVNGSEIINTATGTAKNVENDEGTTSYLRRNSGSL